MYTQLALGVYFSLHVYTHLSRNWTLTDTKKSNSYFPCFHFPSQSKHQLAVVIKTSRCLSGHSVDFHRPYHNCQWYTNWFAWSENLWRWDQWKLIFEVPRDFDHQFGWCAHKICYGIIESPRNLKENTLHLFCGHTMPAGCLTGLSVKASMGTMMNNFGSCLNIGLALKGLTHLKQRLQCRLVEC